MAMMRTTKRRHEDAADYGRVRHLYHARRQLGEMGIKLSLFRHAIQ